MADRTDELIVQLLKDDLRLMRLVAETMFGRVEVHQGLGADSSIRLALEDLLHEFDTVEGVIISRVRDLDWIQSQADNAAAEDELHG